MPPLKTRARRRRELSLMELFELQVGPRPHRRPAFRSDAARRAAWLDNRERALASDPPGHRCWAWWVFEAQRPDLAVADEAAQLRFLAQHGHLPDDERAHIRAEAGQPRPKNPWCLPDWEQAQRRAHAVGG